MKKEKKKLLAVMFEDDFDVIGLGGGDSGGGSSGGSSSGGGDTVSQGTITECGKGFRNGDGTVTVIWA